jgi:hypothetical protein
MHSFQPSRGRVLFDFLCALGMVVSCVGAWKQTGASALLAAASVAALFGFVRLLDLRRPNQAVEPQRIEFENEVEADVPAPRDTVVPLRVAPVEQEAVVEPAKPQRESRGAKPPSKAAARRAKAPKTAKVVELASPDVTEALELSPAEEIELSDPASTDEMEFFEPVTAEESAQPHIAPLFEPDPFARMPRPAFGRRGRL